MVNTYDLLGSPVQYLAPHKIDAERRSLFFSVFFQHLPAAKLWRDKTCPART